jgi:hypothetical protein
MTSYHLQVGHDGVWKSSVIFTDKDEALQAFDNLTKEQPWVNIRLMEVVEKVIKTS